MRPFLTRFLVPTALAALVLPALAAPLPSPRGRPVPAGDRGARPLAALPAGDPAGACGTRLDALDAQLERRAALPLAVPLPTPHSADVDGIAVLEDDGTFFYTDKTGDTVLDVAAVTHAFYATHDDSVTFLAVYLASGLNQWLGSPTALAAAWPVRNAIDGIGLGHYDLGAALGSPARLEQVLTMNGLHRYPDDPDAPLPGDTFDAMGILAHEFGHRWLAYVRVDSAGTISTALLGRDNQHWNFFFDSDSSFMEGCDWTTVGPDTFVTTGVTSTFGALDQYLMGLRTKAGTGPLLVVNDPTQIQPPGDYVPWSIPAVGVGCDGVATLWSVDDIEAVHGPRVPDAASAPHTWRVAFVLVVPRGQDAGPADLAKLGAIRARFPQVVTEATGARGSVDVTLPSRPGRLAITLDPLPDTEDLLAPRAVTARIARVDGALPLAVDPASVVLHWRAGTEGTFTDVPMAAAGPDSFAAAIPPAAGTVQYWISAATAPVVLAAEWPAGGAAAPATYFAGPDVTPPVVRHVPVPMQGETRLPQVMLARVTDNTALDSVWCEVSVDGAPPAPTAVTHAGHDSFTVALGAGLGRGHAVAYRFVARDASAAGNVGWSNAAFDTMLVVPGMRDDFENPSGYVHQPVTWSFQDPWQTDTLRSSPAGGTAWHFGPPGGMPYPPHSDAALYLPWVYGVVPGVKLAFDEWHDLEQADDLYAWDAFRIEVQPWGGTPVAVEPTPGYTHAMYGSGLSIPRFASCWSGTSGGWVTRTVDLSPWAPGPARVIVHAVSDEWIGASGIWIDRVRVLEPPGSLAAPPTAGDAVACGRAWPNPTHGTLRLPLTLPRPAVADWALLDVQGRRVATLWRGTLAAGPRDLAGTVPSALAPGLYFARLTVGGLEASTQRIAIVR